MSASTLVPVRIEREDHILPLAPSIRAYLNEETTVSISSQGLEIYVQGEDFLLRIKTHELLKALRTAVQRLV